MLGRKKWLIRVEIVESRAGNKVLDEDMARRIKTEDSGWIIELKKRKKQLQPIPLSYFYLTKNGSSKLKLATEDNVKYQPIRINIDDDPDITTSKEWDVVDYQTAIKLKDLFKKTGFMEKYGHILLLLIFGMILVFGISISMNKLSEATMTAQQSLTVAGQNLEATNKLAQALIVAVNRVSGTSGVPNPTPTDNGGAPPY